MFIVSLLSLQNLFDYYYVYVLSFRSRINPDHNGIPSSNQKDVLKCRKASRDHEHHINNFRDMTQIDIYMRDLIMNIMNLNWDKYPLRNENHGILK